MKNWAIVLVAIVVLIAIILAGINAFIGYQILSSNKISTTWGWILLIANIILGILFIGILLYLIIHLFSKSSPKTKDISPVLPMSPARPRQEYAADRRAEDFLTDLQI